MTTTWDPQQYERFAAERARPFQDLVARIPTDDAVAVVDLGCGPGTMTATLAERWPDAAVLGIDTSVDMIDAARRHATDRLDFKLGDIAEWRPARGSVDVIVANASLQWVPGHHTLMSGWATALDDGGTLAVQVPVSGDMLAAAAFEEVATRPRWADRLASVAGQIGPRTASPVQSAEVYLDVLAGAGLTVDAWQTTYFHVLPGSDPVLEWFAGTGLRPYLHRLDGADLADFRAEIADRLRELYPRREYGTVLPFPRLFVIGHR